MMQATENMEHMTFGQYRPVHEDVENKASFEWTNVAAYQIGIDNS